LRIFKAVYGRSLIEALELRPALRPTMELRLLILIKVRNKMYVIDGIVRMQALIELGIVSI
jgi:hypothetical protein